MHHWQLAYNQGKLSVSPVRSCSSKGSNLLNFAGDDN